MTSKATFSGRDYGGEVTRCGVYLDDVSSANFDARAASVAAVLAAINAVTVGNGGFTGQQYNAIDVAIGAKNADPNGQRERKWRVPLVDSIDPLGNWSFEIGMGDATLLVTDGEVMDVSAGDGAALVAALQTHCVSRLGNTVLVGPITLVGRTG